jgi:hypothetical protein
MSAKQTNQGYQKMDQGTKKNWPGVPNKLIMGTRQINERFYAYN